jgi:hypothetical protein
MHIENDKLDFCSEFKQQALAAASTISGLSRDYLQNKTVGALN